MEPKKVPSPKGNDNTVKIIPNKVAVVPKQSKSLMEQTHYLLFVFVASMCAFLLVAFIYLYATKGNASETIFQTFSNAVARYSPSNLLWDTLENYWKVLLTMLLLYCMYRYIKMHFFKKSLAKKIYEKIKSALKAAQTNDNLDHGFTEEQIVSIYANEANMSESEFKNKILPLLKELRRKDQNVREFEKYAGGKYKLAWQWSD